VEAGLISIFMDLHILNEARV